MRDRIPFRVQPMLATLVAQPFDKAGWVYEEKYDGVRMLAYKEGTRVRLLSRNGRDDTRHFPEIVAAIANLRPATLLLDGEVVVFDRKKVSRFQWLQKATDKPTYAVFDCLFAKGKDLRRQPLSARRAALEGAVVSTGVLLLSRRLAVKGLAAFKVAKRRGYEGLVAKDLSSPYIEGRSRSWLKVKVHQEDEFIILGYTAPERSRPYFGALLLGAYDAGELRYVGKVGTGFDRPTLASLYKRFQPLVRRTPPMADPPRERAVTYLRPHLVAQIAYQELTADRKLRQPVYLGLRDDKRAEDVTLPEPQ
ncbi:MAG TPA: non-homologous end-joining DNA ligase [Gemmatimonadaceae bacterium]|nr:non-homologous end-joining DNA ligase [Gemmatimonadaceae bacterium]